MDLLVEADRLPAREQADYRAAGGRRIAAHDHDDARAPAGESVLHRRRTRSASRIRPTRWTTTRASRACAATIPGFSHATAFHEMIPGHNLVGFMGARFSDYRANLSGGGPFFGEGWPLYWELILYDMGFDKTPEQKVGALFWRMHRCARIIFSLKFHMGQWSPQEAIDFLVDRVGPRARQRHRRSAPLVRSGGRLRPALPGRVPARRLAAARAAQGARRHEDHDQHAVPRRDHAPGRHADRAAAPGRQQPAQARRAT